MGKWGKVFLRMVSRSLSDIPCFQIQLRMWYIESWSKCLCPICSCAKRKKKLEIISDFVKNILIIIG